MKRLLPVLLVVFAACSGSDITDHRHGQTGVVDTVSDADAARAEVSLADVAPDEDAAADTDTATPPPECRTSADCLLVITDLGPCEAAACNATTRRCERGPKKNGDACDDDDACTLDTVCRGGACTDGRPLECTTANPCAVPACEPALGCVLRGNDGAACDDGNPCTAPDLCVGTACAATGDACDDADPCTADACVEEECQHVPQAGPGCDCETDADCDDHDPCTADLCGPDGRCLPPDPAPDGTPCDDLNACTTGDLCRNGGCIGSANVCAEVLCADRLDNEGDGLTDCDDPDCDTEVHCGESDCADTIDNELDGRTDCADEECIEDLACFSQCTATVVTGCDQQVNGATEGARNQIGYHLGCTDRDETGGEYIYQVTLPADATLTATLLDVTEGVDLDLFVLEGSCDSASCVGFGEDSLTQPLIAGRTYFVVVDGRAGAAGLFTLRFDCALGEVDCRNGLDDDFDGATDCDDTSCATNPGCLPEGDCTNGADDDLDGATDCLDPDCEELPECGPTIENCGNEQDDDEDSFVDCFDMDCIEDPLCARTCTAVAVAACDSVVTGRVGAGVDQITWYPACTERRLSGAEYVMALAVPRNTYLTARLDTEADLDVLVLDATCSAYSCTGASDNDITLEAAGGQTYYVVVDGPAGVEGDFAVTLQCYREMLCDDGVDDDGDGQTDCRDVEDCSDRPGCVETRCTDGLDDDGDGALDCNDSDCHGSAACTCEVSDVVACNESVQATNVSHASRLDRYACAPAWAESAPEHVLSFTAPYDGTFTARLFEASPQLDVFVLEGVCSATECIAHDEDGDGAVSFAATEGVTYFVAVDGFEGYTGPFTAVVDCGDLEEFDCGDGVDNDFDERTDCLDPDCLAAAECRNVCSDLATPITCGQTRLSTNEGKRNHFSGYGCNAFPEFGGEVIYRFTPTRSELVQITLGTQGADLDLYVLGADCESGFCVGTGDDLQLQVVAGVTYYLVVDGYQGAVAPFDLTVSCPLTIGESCIDGADNDGDGLADCDDPDCLLDLLCADATCTPDGFVGCGERVQGTTVGQAFEMGSYGSCPATTRYLDGGEVVLRFATAADKEVTARLTGLTDNLDIAVFAGACGTRYCTGYAGEASSQPEELVFQASAGESYYLVIDPEFWDSTFTLDIECR